MTTAGDMYFTAVVALAMLHVGAGLLFSGREWTVRSAEKDLPGPNSWSSSNAWVDDLGHLHLKISQVNGSWQCAEVSTVDKLSFGRYQWFVDGAIDQLDPAVVLGFFTYDPDHIVGYDGASEIDIEYPGGGKPANFTVMTGNMTDPVSKSTENFNVSLSSTLSTQSFVWSSSEVAFSAQRGHQDNNDKDIYSDWTFTNGTDGVRVPQHEENAFINLWLNNGSAPFNNKEVEIIIYAFKYTPLE